LNAPVSALISSESMAFAKAIGLNPRMVYNIIRGATGDSFMCEPYEDIARWC